MSIFDYIINLRYTCRPNTPNIRLEQQTTTSLNCDNIKICLLVSEEGMF